MTRLKTNPERTFTLAQLNSIVDTLESDIRARQDGAKFAAKHGLYHNAADSEACALGLTDARTLLITLIQS